MRARPLLAAAVVLLAPLAGCLGPDGDGGLGRILGRASGAAVAFSDPVVVDAGRPAAEPSLRVATDGTIWVTAPAGLGRGDNVWRSTDGGATFAHAGVPDGVFGGGDSDLAIDDSGRLWQTGLWLGCVSAATSRDGASWAMNPLVCGVPLDDRQWIETHGESTAFLTFGSGAGGGTAAIQLARLEALPTGHPALVSVLPLPGSSDYQWPGNLAIAPDGTIYVAYLTEDDEAFVYRSKDGGQTATKHPVAKREGETFDSFAVVAVDRAGNVYLTWSERDETRNETAIWIASSRDEGESWSEPVRVNAVPRTAIFPWIAAGEDGRIAVAYYGTESTGPSAEDVDGAWHVYVSLAVDALAASPIFAEARVTSVPIIEGGICTSGLGCPPGTRTLLDYFQVALDPEGRAHVAYAAVPPGKDRAVVVHAKQTQGPRLVAGGAP